MASRNIFALGDAAETGDFMTIVAITRQAPWLFVKDPESQ